MLLPVQYFLKPIRLYTLSISLPMKQKNELGSLDFLYHYLITEVYSQKKFFDFGISNEEQGRKLNEGLQFWKEGFGARTVVQDFYEVETGNHSVLEKAVL